MQVTEEDLRAEFGAFGEITGLKPCHKGGYGFVTFRDHSAAVQAIVGMNGKDLKGKVRHSLHATAIIACSWQVLLLLDRSASSGFFSSTSLSPEGVGLLKMAFLGCSSDQLPSGQEHV